MEHHSGGQLHAQLYSILSSARKDSISLIQKQEYSTTRQGKGLHMSVSNVFALYQHVCTDVCKVFKTRVLASFTSLFVL